MKNKMTPRHTKPLDNDLQKHTPYFIFLILLAAIFFYFQITNNGLMIWYGDSFEQQLSFYLGGWEKFHSLDFSLWSWSLGLGANYLSYVFYFASSPFFFLTLLFPKQWIPYLFLYLNLIKLGLILVFTYQWLLKLKSIRWIALTGAIALAFSGWVVFFFHYNHFLDAFIFYPLILWFIEHWIQTRRFFGLTLLIGLLGLTNYYFLYMFVPFIGLYTIYRLGSTSKQFPWKRLFSMIGIGILGLGLSAVLLLPSLNLVIKTPRLSESISFLAHISLKDLYRYVSTFFMPVMERFDPSYFLSTEVYQGLGWGGGVSLNLLMITPLMLPFSFLTKDNREKIYRLCFYSLLGLFTFFLVFYRLFQGSLDVRWYYMISLLNLISLVEGLFVIHTTEKFRRFMLPVGIMIVGVLSILYYISRNREWVGSLNNLSSLKSIIFILILFLFVHISILYFKPKLVWISITAEALLIFSIPLYHDKPMTEIGLNLTHYQNISAIDYIKESDPGFYRILNDTVLYSSPNEPFAKQYNGLSFYLSLYNFEQEDYLSRLKGTWSMPHTFGRFQTYNLLSTKYFITRDHTHTVPFGFDFLMRIGSEYIYRNKYYIPLGFATSKTINEDAFKELSYLNQDRILMDTIVTKESLIKTPTYLNELIQLYKWTEPIDINIPLSSINQNIYVESFDIPSITIKAYGQASRLHDQMLFDQYTWQYNYTGIHIDQASNIERVKIEFNNLYQSPTLVNVYLETNLDVYEKWFDDLVPSSFKDVSIEGDRINAHVEVYEEESWIFTSIPHDKGWEVKINGSRVNYEKVNLGFIGFKLEPGSYDVHFEYTPPLIRLGALITAASLSILFVLVRRKVQVRSKGL